MSGCDGKCPLDALYKTGIIDADYHFPGSGWGCKDLFSGSVQCKSSHRCRNTLACKSCGDSDDDDPLSDCPLVQYWDQNCSYQQVDGAIGIPDCYNPEYKDGGWKSKYPLVCYGGAAPQAEVEICDKDGENCHMMTYENALLSDAEDQFCDEYGKQKLCGCTFKRAFVPVNPDMPPVTNDPGNMSLKCCLDEIDSLPPDKKPPCAMNYCSQQPPCGEVMSDYVKKYGYDHNVEEFLGLPPCPENANKVAMAVVDYYVTDKDVTKLDNNTLDTVYAACNKAPGACDTQLKRACENMTYEDAVNNLHLNNLCGCFLPTELYQNSYPPVIDPICTPFCLPALHRGDGKGGFQSCENSNCVIDDLTITIINSTTGPIDISQFCGSQGKGKFNCYFSNVAVTEIDSKVKGKVHFKSTCDDCMSYDPNDFNKMKPIPGCDLSRCTDQECFTKQPDKPYCNPVTGDCVECLSDPNCADDGKCIDNKCTTKPVPPKVCPNNCSGNGDCDGTTGVCKCYPGWIGNDCGTSTSGGGGGNGNGGLSTGTKWAIGISVGVVVLVLILVLLYFRFKRKAAAGLKALKTN